MQGERKVIRKRFATEAPNEEFLIILCEFDDEFVVWYSKQDFSGTCDGNYFRKSDYNTEEEALLAAYERFKSKGNSV